MRFRYEGVDASGNAASGHLEARGEREAVRQLSGQGIVVVSLREQHERSSLLRNRARASARELQLVLQEFATLLGAGVTLATALSSLAKSSHHPQLTGAFAGMERAVRRGESFSA